MAVTPVKIGGAGSTTSAQTSVVAALTAGASVGDVVVFIAGLGTAKQGTTPTDTKGNTWNLVAQPQSGTAAVCNMWYSVLTTALTTSDTITTTWTGSVARRSWIVLKCSGLTATPLDVSGTANAASATSLSLSTGTATAQADELVIAAYGWDETASTTNAVMSADAGYTVLDQELAGGGGTNQIGCGVEWLETSATGVQTASPTMNETCAGLAGVIATFKVASSAVNMTATDALTSFGGSATATVTVNMTATDALTAFRGSATASVSVNATATDALTHFGGSAVMTSGTFLTATDALTAFRGSASMTLTIPMTATGATAFAGRAVIGNPVLPGWKLEVGWDRGTGLFVIGSSKLGTSPTVPSPTILGGAGVSGSSTKTVAHISVGAGVGSCVVAIFSAHGALSPTCADTKGNTWHVYDSTNINGAEVTVCVSVLTTALTTSDTITLTYTSASSGRSYSVASYGAGMIALPVDAIAATQETGGTTVTARTGKLNQSIEVAIFAVSFYDGGSGDSLTGVTSGWTSRASQSEAFGAGLQNLAWYDHATSSSSAVAVSGTLASGATPPGEAAATVLLTLQPAASPSSGDALGGPYSDPTWSVVDEVQQVQIQRGRQDAVADVQAGELTVTLVDTNGTYNPKNSSSPLSGRLKPRRFGRLSYGWPDGLGGFFSIYLYRGYIREIQGPQSRQSPYSTITFIDVLEELSTLKPVIASTGATTTGGAITAILSAVGYPSTLRSVATGDSVPDFSADGSTDALTLIGSLLAAELGEFFIAADGTATYIDHSGRQTRAGTITSTNLLAPGVSLETVVTQATVTRTDQSGNALGAPQTYQDDDAVRDYNVRVPGNDPLSTPYVSTDDQALSLATRMVALWKDPRSPIWTLQLNMRPDDPTTYQQMLSRDLGDRIAVDDPATGGGGDYTIEGIQHQVDTAALNHVTTWALLERPSGDFVIGTSLVGSLDSLGV